MDWSRIDGEARQAVAGQLWLAWRDGTHPAGLVVGFSGVGKTVKLAGALMAAAKKVDSIAIRVDMPPIGIDAQAGLIAELAEMLIDEEADSDLVEKVKAAVSLKSALKAMIMAGVLVVVDDIQRQFDADGSAPNWLDKAMTGLPDPDPDRGWVLLLSNRAIDEVPWIERCRNEVFESPKADTAVCRAILDDARSGTVARLGPRLDEVINRLGANPRALGLLARQLDYASLDELLGPAEPAATMTSDPLLVEKLEAHIIERAADGLGPDARALMLWLSVLQAPAPFELVEEIGEGLDVRRALKVLRARRLSRAGNREALNPVAIEVGRTRLRADPEAWQEAHQRAGRYYARPLVKGISGRPASYTSRLSSALYHLERSGDAGLYGRVMQAAREAVVEAFHWFAPKPSNSRERDAQIDLLQQVLKEAGPKAAHYQLAKRLLDRADAGDWPLARDHARFGAEGEDDAAPWVLWIKATRAADGLEASVAAAEEAAKKVAPGKNIYAVYQLLGWGLDHLDRTTDAVKALLTRIPHERGRNRVRLAEQALSFAAAAADPSILASLRQKLAAAGNLGPTTALGEVLAKERLGAWPEAARAAADGLSDQPKYLPLAVQQALAELGSARPEAALSTLEQFPIPWRHSQRQANT